MRRTVILLFLSLSLVAPPGAVAQESFDVDAATQAYLAQVPTEERARSDAYFEGGYWLLLWGALYTGAAMWLMLRTGWSGRARDFAARLTGRSAIRVWIYGLIFVLAYAALLFPFTWYTGFFREHQYDLSNLSFAAWMGQELIGLAIALIVAPPALVAFYAVVRRAPRTWWLWGAALALAFEMGGTLLGPVLIMPLFNTYTPVEEPEVREAVLSMARANGVPAENVYVVDASRQTSRISANVSGLLGTTRISLNDNLLNRTSLPEIKAGMAHELGHYVLHHAYKSLLFFALFYPFALGLVQLSLAWVLDRWGAAWNVQGAEDPAGVPAIVTLMAIGALLTTPLTNTWTRVQEQEADIFGLNVAREPDGWAEVVLKLGEYRKLDPSPFEEFLFYDHPSGRTRIYTAMRWKAEHLGEPR